MIYIRLEEKLCNEIQENNYLLQIIYKIKKKFSKLKIEKYEDKILINIFDIDKETLKKISEYIKENCVSTVCLSDNLLKNNGFTEFIRNENVKIIDGKWLFKHLTYNVLKYIVNMKKEEIELQEVSILSNNISRIVVKCIKDIAVNVKTINVITEREIRFRKLEEELYLEDGVILNMNNNYKKSLIKSDVIFNFDFNEKELIKYTLPQNACLINLDEDISLDPKKFEGINCNFYTIAMPNKYIKSLTVFKGFSFEVLYESFIYKNTSPENIEKELKEDKINIISLNSNVGRIRKTEIYKLSKKVVI